MKLFLYCVFVQLITAVSYAAPPVVVQPGKDRYFLGGHIEILEDARDQWTIVEVMRRHRDGQFKDSNRDIPNFGYTRSAIWLKFTVEPMWPYRHEILLEFDWPHADFIELFVYTVNEHGTFRGTKHKLAGRKVLVADWEYAYRNFLFNLPLEARKTHIVFIKLKTVDSLRAPLMLWEKEAFWPHAKNEYHVLGFYYGLMFVIIVYNLLVYLTTKDLSFLLFTLHMASTALFEFSFNGLATEYLWPGFPGITAISMSAFVFLLTGFAVIFSNQFLNLKKNFPYGHKLLNIVLGLSVMGLVGLLVMPSHIINPYTACLAGIFPPVLLWTSFRCVKLKIPFSKHFIFIWTLMLIATTIAGLTFLGVFPHTSFTNYFHQVCSALEAILFSIVLAGRINVLREKNKEIELHGLQIEKERAAAQASSQAKSAFLANMSHEIRTPINAVTGMLYLLKQTDLTPVQQDFTEKMRVAANTLLGIINDILDISKIEAGKLKLEHIDFDLGTVIENVTTLVEMKTAEKHLDLVVACDDVPCTTLYGDPLRLGQVLTNLVNNAVKFTETGEIGIYCQKIGTDRFRFDVKDTGIGMTKQEMDRLFQAFSQADISTTRKYGGTGLGLAISKRLVEMMDGRIWVESQPGKGTCFSFEATIVEQPDKAVEISGNTAFSINGIGPQSEHSRDPAVLKNQLTSLKGSHILLVEDNQINREIICGMLANTGIMISEAENGKIALDMYRKDPGRYELILMDIQMPVMDGYEATRQIRKFDKNVPIIALTASAMDSDVAQAMKMGVDKHIGKPIEVPELFGVLLRFIPKKCDPRDLSSSLETGNPAAGKDSGPPAQAAALNFTHIDVRDGLNRVMGNKTLYSKLLTDFVHEYQGITARLRDLMDHDPGQAVRIAHTIKGLSGSIGARGLSKLAGKLEDTLEPALLPAFDDALTGVIAEIMASPVFKPRKPPSGTPPAKTPASGRHGDDLWQTLVQAIEKRRPQHIKPVLAKLEAAGLDAKDQQLLEKVAKALEKYRFGNALDEIKQHKKSEG